MGSEEAKEGWEAALRVPSRSDTPEPSRDRLRLCPGQAMKEPGSGQHRQAQGRRDQGRLWPALHGGGDVQGREEPSLWPGTQAGDHRTQ